jgi:hypothetical protein
MFSRIFFSSPLLLFILSLVILFSFSPQPLCAPSPQHSSSSAFVPFYFIHHSDPQIGRSPEGESNLDTAVAQIGRMRPAPSFIVIAGDMADNPVDSAAVHDQWTRCRTRFNRLSIPKYYAPGNNDVGYPSELQTTPRMITWFRNFWGPDYYSFDRDSCHFIVLNSTLLNCYSGHIHYPTSMAQDSFLRWDLQNIQSKHRFFLWHFPPYYSDPLEANTTGNVNRPRRDTLLLDLINHDFTAVFTGHTHGDLQNLYGPSLLQTGLATCTGSLTSTGYRIVKVFRNGIETWTVYLSSPLDTLSLINIVTVTATPETVQINQPVTFRAVPDTARYPGWGGLTYRWIFGDGDSARIATTTHAYRDTGHYRIVFTGTKPPSIGSLYYFNIFVRPLNYVAEERAVFLDEFSLRVPTIQKGFITFELNALNAHNVPNDRDVFIYVYNISGRQAIGPLNFFPGKHRVRYSENLPSGIYFFSLTTSTGSVLKKIILLR